MRFREIKNREITEKLPSPKELEEMNRKMQALHEQNGLELVLNYEIVDEDR